MKRFLMIFLSLMIFLAMPAYADSDGNLIYNGDFSHIDANGLPDGWSRGMWFTDTGVSQLYVDENGYEGSCIAVVNADANDARFEQTLRVEPNSIYRFSCMVKAENCGSEGYGATLSFENTFSYSDSVLDTNGEWRELTVYGRTGEDQKEIVLMARIGGYGMINTGRAWFDNIEVRKVDEAPDGAVVVALQEESSSGGSSSSETTSDEAPKRNTETYLLLAALYGVLILALMRRADRLENSRINSRRLLAFGLACAFIFRLVLSVLVRGYNTDINCFSAWSERMFSLGPVNFYAEDYFCDYPPAYMLLLGIPAAIRSLFGFTVQGSAHLVLLKLMPIICDLLGAWIIWLFAQKKQPASRFGVLLALIYAFNPAVFIDSAAWGQIDSVFTLFVVLCAIKAADENYIPSLLCFAAAMLIKPQAMLFAPLGLFAIVVFLIRRRSAKKVREFAYGIAAAVALIYVVAFVFSIGRAEGPADAFLRPVEWIISLYGETMGSYSYLTINALNLYCLLNFNWTATAAQPAWTIFAWCMFALAYLYSCFLCAKSRKQHHLLLAGAVLMTLIFTFGPMIHERYIYPALLLLTLACILERDRRLLISLTLLTVTAAMNEILVLQGGMGTGNYGHLQTAEQWLNGLLSLINVVNALFLSLTALDICVLGSTHPLKLETDTFIRSMPAPKNDHRLRLTRWDALLMTVVTLIYSVAAFTNLGTTEAPQTTWISSRSGESIVFDLGETRAHRMTYYGGICNSTFTVELSNNGETWTDPYYARYDQGEIFRWLYYVPMNESLSAVMDQTWNPGDGSAYVTFSSSDNEHPMQRSRYVRITAQSAGLRLSEVGFWGDDGSLIEVQGLTQSGEYADYAANPRLLIDEQHTVPEAPSYYNSTYFDEIYHARTAYELLHGESVYEWTHPPLGKVLMMVGIQIFGMTPFGWRFMGALIGVMMLPLMYLLAKQLCKSSKLAFAAMCLMALDSMHFTQTRIATIDSYAVFWIMLMYLFMIRHIQMDWKEVSTGRSFVSLGLCGITMGIAIATKWIGCYAAVGLAILLFWKLIREICSAGDRRQEVLKRCLWTVLFCLAFFIIIPVLIYYFSHFWQLRYEGVSTFWDMFDKQRIKRVVNLQKSMLDYHAGLGGDTHYFRSPWYQWPIIWWPMWYYSGTAYMPDGVISSISCMGNPAVWWAGLAALLFILVMTAWKRRAPRSWLIVLIGFASQFLPWVLVPRSTFIYHYFASVPFIILCTVLTLKWLKERSENGFRWTCGTLIVLALILFAAFYPLESGMPVARDYAQYLRWFNWYNF